MSAATTESRRRVWLYVAAGAVFAALSARGVTVPLYAHSLGATRFEIGALFSVSTFAAAALSLPAGVLVDRFGARNLLAVSLVATAVSQLATAFTTTVPPLFFWQVVGGLAAGTQQSAIFSAVTESVTRGRLGRAMGWLTLSMQVGFTLGPAVAGIALKWIDLRTDIALTTALLVFALPGTVAVSQTRQHTGRGLSLRAPLAALARQAAFVPVTLGLVSATLAWGTFQAFAPVFAQEQLALPTFQVGLLLALQSLFNAGSRPVAGRLVDSAQQRWPIVLAGVTGWSITIAVVGHLTGFFVPAVVIAIGTPFIATAFVTAGVVYGDLSSASTRGVTMGIYGTVLFLGLSAGPLVFGPLVQAYGYAAGFTACAATAVALVAVMAAMQAGLPRRRTAQEPLGDSETPPAVTRRA
ncbi:MAG TPA: MFS transporter [Candidatus Dormibacteraeota bacterium]|nr:MFS transporter [Candidatus Dormibacteraeota bacterium]